MTASQTEKMRKLFADKQVSTEELEAVAGGYCRATVEKADDSRFLNVLLQGRSGQPNRYGETRAGSEYECNSIAKEVESAWKSVGIGFRSTFEDYGNKYWDLSTGESIGQAKAYYLAEQRVGRKLKKSDWYWD